MFLICKSLSSVPQKILNEKLSASTHVDFQLFLNDVMLESYYLSNKNIILVLGSKTTEKDWVAV